MRKAWQPDVLNQILCYPLSLQGSSLQKSVFHQTLLGNLNSSIPARELAACKLAPSSEKIGSRSKPLSKVEGVITLDQVQPCSLDS